MRFFKILTLCLALAGLTAVSAAEIGSSYPSISSMTTTSALQRNSVTMQPSYSEGVVDSNYVLGPGDYLDIMLENTYLSAKVYPDGSVIIEECGVVNVSGKTMSQVREEILKIVSNRYDPKYCFVQLAQMKKMIVNVMGAVPQTGQVFVEPQTRLTRLLKNVGEVLPQGRGDSILLFRGNDTICVNSTKIFNEGDFASDIVLQPGDQVFIPFADMKNSVTLVLPNYRVAVPYHEGHSVADYYMAAGGNRIHNMGYQSITIHNKDNSSTSIPVSHADKFFPEAESEVEYTMKPLLVYVGGAVAGVGRQEYEPSWHALDYISAAGVLTTTASFDQVKVIRGNRETIYVNATADPILPGDFIEIPKSTYERFKDFTLFVASLLTVVSSAFIIYVNYK